MLLVIDANIVVSSLIRGSVTDLILSPKLELIAPELLFVELERNKKEILSKSSFDKYEINILL